MKAWASDLCLLLLMVAIGYSVEALSLAGIVTPLTLEPAACTSVTYTMPASTLPVSTWVSTDFTSGCSVTGLTAIPAFLNTSAATTPHGTCGWQRHLDGLLRQVVHRRHVRGVIGGRRHFHDVLGEVLRVGRVPGADHRVHVRGRRRCEHVGRRAAGDLLRQARARPEAELHRVARVGRLELLSEL